MGPNVPSLAVKFAVFCLVEGTDLALRSFTCSLSANTGEYSEIGGRIFSGTDRETVIQETMMTRIGVDRILEYAFDLAQKRPRKKLTSASE